LMIKINLKDMIKHIIMQWKGDKENGNDLLKIKKQLHDYLAEEHNLKY